MEYGVFSDIHGNLAALKSVWDALTKAGLTDGRPVLNAGDNVGYGDAPEECVRFLCARPEILTVQGNYDKNVALFPEKQAEYQKKWAKKRPEKYEALRRDSAEITVRTRAWLLGLPQEREFELNRVRLLLTHYAPDSKEGLGRWTPDIRLRELGARTDAQVVLCGHTHSPFVRRGGDTLFVNPGTLGRSWFGGPSYAILTLAPDAPPEAQIRQVKL